MAKVEAALGRLDGVHSVSAGFRSDSAYVAIDETVPLDLKKVNEALQETRFSCLSITRRNRTD